MDVALLRAKAKAAGIRDIRQRGGEVSFTLTSLDLQRVSRICGENAYKNRLYFAADAKEPTLRLKLAPGSDSLRQSTAFVERYAAQV